MSNKTPGAILPNRYTRSLGLIGRLRGWFAVNRGCSYPWDSWVMEAVAGKIKIGQGGTAVYRPRYRNGWTGSKQ